MGRITAAAGAAVAIMLAVAPGASAANSCQYNASLHRVSLSATTGPTSLAVRRSGTKIQWRGGNGAYLDCGAATVTNTDDIQYVETAGPGGTTTTFEIDLSGGPFAPGYTPEGMLGSAEIEFHTLFGSGDGDVLKITSPAAALHVRFGAQGANLNSSERLGVDQDLTIGNEPPDFYVLTGSPEADEVSG